VTQPLPAVAATVDATRRSLARTFREHGIDNPDLDARVLTAHALGLDHTGLVAAGPRHLSAEEMDCIAALAARRLKREPVARILGTKEFWSLELTVTDAVLVPRPETETVVEAALAAIDVDGPRSRVMRIADIGTGSGALLLALLCELPNAVGIGTDRDPAAVMVARENAQRLGLATRSLFAVCDHGAALAGMFDLVVSNPPYIASREIARLDPEVRDYDPRLALDGGRDGLTSYHALSADAARLLRPRGHLCIEIGATQSADVTALFTAAGATVVHDVHCDLGGIPRVFVARKIP
jgi:release factor glutamine methyltransferase